MRSFYQIFLKSQHNLEEFVEVLGRFQRFRRHSPSFLPPPYYTAKTTKVKPPPHKYIFAISRKIMWKQRKTLEIGPSLQYNVYIGTITTRNETTLTGDWTLYYSRAGQTRPLV